MACPSTKDQPGHTREHSRIGFRKREVLTASSISTSRTTTRPFRTSASIRPSSPRLCPPPLTNRPMALRSKKATRRCWSLAGIGTNGSEGR